MNPYLDYEVWVNEEYYAGANILSTARGYALQATLEENVLAEVIEVSRKAIETYDSRKPGKRDF